MERASSYSTLGSRTKVDRLIIRSEVDESGASVGHEDHEDHVHPKDTVVDGAGGLLGG
eukprot:CAMPEP_0194755926 /NCGR_PEP_ID=MMETSP0323_2-20130528/9711_1 /TAXON_ID=2866 ORGANISM="Crypthecodinium cohnii, Strain Seligo" /NCGR_SAMPLE_ID=MMETSP0323_2 /ASSEMBLY_ACC=CAM_ASM_000346 /LENGTH=57 /DNA_ID=CAMNT_0039675207 /DNA_START=123 /DNA_END=293 /DNA_ORIENTATION=+